MYKVNKEIIYSPTDLCRFMASPFASWMERYQLEADDNGFTPDDNDPFQSLLQEKGEQHEAGFIRQFQEQGMAVVEIQGESIETKVQATKEAIESGVDVIYQACLDLHPFRGYADFLVKVEGESDIGHYHYEVWDTKLAKTPKPYFVVQLCCYAEMLARIQGVYADDMVVVLGNGQLERLRSTDYRYFYENLKSQFLDTEETFDIQHMPDPADSRDWGRWTGVAEQILIDKDHLSQVATITRGQIKALEKAGIDTATALAETPKNSVRKMSPTVFRRLKAQAQIQQRSIGLEIPAFEIIQPGAGEARGLSLLPPASPLDVFFDIEGFPLVEGGLEYLWGNTYFDEEGQRQFRDFWAHNAVEEKKAFQSFVQWVYNRWKQDPGMHIYHYANYEVAACRRLMGCYGVCEHEIDELLRNEVFVDLYNIVRHGMLIGEPRYSIKNVEHLYRGKRETEVGSGGDSVVVYQQWIDHPDGESWETSELLKGIRDYNIDDCDSTQELVEWLRERQKENSIPYLGKTEADEKEMPEEITARIQLRNDLLEQSEQERESGSEWADITETLAWLLEFHRREEKPTWWRLFDRLGLSDYELLDDLDCLAMCERTDREPFKPTTRARNHAYEYRFDTNQEYKRPREGSSLWVHDHDGVKVTLHEFDPIQGLITVKAQEEPPPRITLIPNDIVRASPIPEAIEDVVRRYSQGQRGDSALIDFLKRRSPRINGYGGGSIIQEDSQEDILDQVIRQVTHLDNSYLCIQGPPGAGKSFTGKHVIAELVAQGKKIGIASNSHKAINNLLLGAARQCQELNLSAHCCCTKETDPEELQEAGILVIKNGELIDHVRPGCVIGTTAWGFSRDDMVGQLDYLFIDEAGQVSIANLVGMSRSANNLVIKGDQMQLGQPIQGVHPGESGQSILEYLLQEHATIPPGLGVFLGTTYRMHPEVNHFISEAVYEGRLHTAEGNERQIIMLPDDGGGLINKEAGIIYFPVDHEGNAQASEEEAGVIHDLAESLLGRTFIDKDGNHHRIGWEHMLFVAPYNYQVNVLQEMLGDQARIGSVDKFQGQEAPVVFISLCASDINEAPRGIGFLLNKNRLNVAVSRAQSLAIVASSPRLVSDYNGNIEDMKLINLMARLMQYQSY